MTSPQELKKIISYGLLSFPLTDFDSQLRFAPKPFAERLEWLMPYGATALFAAGGTGEFFSLEPQEFSQVIKTAIDTCRGRMPIIAGAGGGTTLAIKYAQEAERLGAQGVLLLPHYLTEASQEGLIAHIEALCKSVKFGVIVYNRGVCKLQPDTLARLAERCPNLIGFKDGLGDIERIVSIRQQLGDRFVYIGGMPTHEVYANAYKALGVPTYSSAVFNFVPEFSTKFYAAVRRRDRETVQAGLRDFIMPLLAIRNRKRGYAVSMIKAGMKVIGRDSGPVRSPLTDLTSGEVEELSVLVSRLKASEFASRSLTAA